MGNNIKTLHKGRVNKADEFYTCLADIEKELDFYIKEGKNRLYGKVVYCNCDNPQKSNFAKYFMSNFDRIGIRKLVCTFYDENPYAFIYNGKGDSKKVELKADEGFNPDDTEESWQNGKYGAGDFRSCNCIEYLKSSDIVITNPPFSLFRDFMKVLVAYEKKFLIIGNTNVITYKEIFPLIKEGKLWLGCTNFNVGMMFEVPDYFEKFHHIDEKGKKIARVSTSCWWTNLENERRWKDFAFKKSLSEIEQKKYDNYDAINLNSVKDIPYDYYGKIGVPITFLDKHNPDEFEIVGKLVNGSGAEYYDFGPPIVDGKMMYARLIIQKKAAV